MTELAKDLLTTGDAVDVDEASGSAANRALLRLRELIVSGELPAGQRIPELTLVERLGVSRTPVRAALARLAEEGLLEALPGGGHAPRDFSETDIVDAIALRGTLEGLAARLAAERGAGAVVMAGLRDCVARIDALLAPPALSEAAFDGYVLQNGRFHALLAQACGSSLVQRQIQRAATLPFASANSFVMVSATGPDARDALVVAHSQHRAVLDAIAHRQGARAESLMREHACIAQNNLQQALQSQQALQRLPGARLIRLAGR